MEKKDFFLFEIQKILPSLLPALLLLLPRCLNLTFLSWQKFMLNKVSLPALARPAPQRDVHVYSAMHNNLFYIASSEKQDDMETQLS